MRRRNTSNFSYYPEEQERRGTILRTLLFFGVLAALCVLLAFAVRRFERGHISKADASALQKGLAYLSAQDAQDPAAVEETIKAQLQAKLAAEREQRLQEMLNGEVNVWTMFQDYAFMGDSRTVGLYVWNFLPHERVFAEAGATILWPRDHLEEVKALNPSMLILCFGLNDVSLGFWPTAEEYATGYLNLLTWIKQEMPDVKIYVNSIFPAKDPAFEKSASWYKIPDYNVALKAMCEENGYAFIDNTQLAEEHMALYEQDGIHFYKQMYDLWAANMMMTILQDE